MGALVAITVMAGLSSATILTLLVIPMVYYVFAGRDKPAQVAADAVPADEVQP